MAFKLGDDGTMDTVLVCENCGKEVRFNYDGMQEETEETTDADREEDYAAFIIGCEHDADSEHECWEDDDENE